MNEREWIARLRQKWKNIGDDAFFLEPGEEEGKVVITTDVMVEGVHFRLDWDSPVEIGWKIVARNLSDLAAMGAKPRYFFLSVAFPEGYSEDFLNSFRSGVEACCREWDTEWVGGDTSFSASGWFLCGIALGSAENPVSRSGARFGDKIVLTNTLGLSGLYLEMRKRGMEIPPEVEHKKSRPIPRIKEGLMIAPYASSMIDISDGLSSELHRLAEESKRGFFVEKEKIPIDPLVREWAEKLGLDALQLALSSGEEYQLLFTASEEDMEYLQVALPVETGSHIVALGDVGMPSGVFLVVDGEKSPLPETGWLHSF
ncbi:MAG: thiamine-phosphate kinase [bacterium JZ-2024 1]